MCRILSFAKVSASLPKCMYREYGAWAWLPLAISGEDLLPRPEMGEAPPEHPSFVLSTFDLSRTPTRFKRRFVPNSSPPKTVRSPAGALHNVRCAWVDNLEASRRGFFVAHQAIGKTPMTLLQATAEAVGT